ncbi:hypothetical protein FPQ18DRAFT_425951 [Pyronema domesticum]|nr:hypothetical protein FPQ18DRAFT_425951 [Pyronema domesticum]
MTNSHIQNTNLLTFLRQRILILSPSSWTPPSYILNISSSDISSTAETYTTPQLSRLILSILLGLPPFHDYPDENIFPKYGAFLNNWKSYVSGSISEEEEEVVEEDRGGGYQDFSGLDILISLRFEFSQLSEDRFVFISRLLLACLRVLKFPELNPTDRIEILQKATSILEKLMGSIPQPEGMVTDKQANSVVPLWRCLMLLTDRAQWWGKNGRFKEGLLKLAGCVFALPNCTALFKLTLKADISQRDVPDVHNVVTILLSALETHLGIPTDVSINAFTPYPFTFPLTSKLDNFNWTNDYNFANLRVMTVAWLMSESQDPRRASLDAPGTNARVVLEHTSGFEGLIRYPESAVRVALVHIFNETRNGGKARALADKKAIEALAKYVDYTRKQQPARGEEFKGYFQLAEWLLPWLWRRRGIDQLFVWKVTLNWLQQIFLGENERVEVKELHPAILLMEQHAELVFPVFDVNKICKDIFRFVLAKTSDPREEPDLELSPSNRRKFYEDFLASAFILGRRKQWLLNTYFFSRVVRATVVSIEYRWMSAASLHTACEIMLHATKKTVFDSMGMANVAMQLKTSIPTVILECIDAVRDAYQKTAVEIPALESTLEILASVTQFATILLVADPQSVELLSLIDFPGGSSETQTDSKIALLRTFESFHPSYHIRESASSTLYLLTVANPHLLIAIATPLLLSIPLLSWPSHPLDYLNSWQEIRELFLAETKTRLLLQAYLPCLVHVLSRLISQPNDDLRQALLMDRLNIELSKKLLEILLLECQSNSSQESAEGIFGICKLLVMVLVEWDKAQDTEWREELTTVITKKELRGVMEKVAGEEREWMGIIGEVLGFGFSGKKRRRVEDWEEWWWYRVCRMTQRGMTILVRI